MSAQTNTPLFHPDPGAALAGMRFPPPRRRVTRRLIASSLLPPSQSISRGIPYLYRARSSVKKLPMYRSSSSSSQI